MIVTILEEIKGQERQNTLMLQALLKRQPQVEQERGSLRLDEFRFPLAIKEDIDRMERMLMDQATEKALAMGPNSMAFVRTFLDKLSTNQQNILKFIACNEIFLMPATVFMLFRVTEVSAMADTEEERSSPPQTVGSVAMGPNSMAFVRTFLDKLSTNQQNILKFIACNEIFLMPATVFMLFSGQGSLIQPFIYYRFLTLRYSSRRNPYCRTLFTEMRILIEHFIMKPACPVFLRKMFLNSIVLVSRLAPTGA
ncbi:UNVERIFIED_CONTAM: hypothetical protein FKN15_014118 [Acipenser sinensis]